MPDPIIDPTTIEIPPSTDMFRFRRTPLSLSSDPLESIFSLISVMIDVSLQRQFLPVCHFLYWTRKILNDQ